MKPPHASLHRLGLPRCPVWLLPTSRPAYGLPQSQEPPHYGHHHARPFHRTALRAARVTPGIGAGPPPEAPRSRDAEEREWWAARRRGHAAALAQGRQDRTRFWEHTHVCEVDGALEIHIDQRKVRHPTTLRPIRLPLSKPLLASALALEWDQLVSIKQAKRQHLIPLTSLTCRAIDIASEAAEPHSAPSPTVRQAITDVLLRHFDTDTLLCWEPFAPPPDRAPPEPPTPSLRDVQTHTFHYVADPLLNPRTGEWGRAGITGLEGVLDPSGGLAPRPQAPGVRQAVERWIGGLDAWELAGLERATLAGKSLVVAARVVADWSEGRGGDGTNDGDESGRRKLGVEEVARAVTVEVEWQTGRWGEVDDTHDVDREDIRRAFGSVILLVSGTGKG